MEMRMAKKLSVTERWIKNNPPYNYRRLDDDRKYMAAMEAKREHEAKYGPFRPRYTDESEIGVSQ